MELRDAIVGRRTTNGPFEARPVSLEHQRALLDAASPDGGQIHVCFRIFPDGVEVDVLRGPASAGSSFPTVRRDRPEHRSFAEWIAGVLKREGLSQEAAARQLGVSVKTVSRWVGGETEPRLRELRRIQEVFGEAPLG